MWVIPFSMLGFYSLRLRKQLLGKLPASNANLNAVVTIGLICSVQGAIGIAGGAGMFFVCTSNPCPESITSAQNIIIIMATGTLFTGVTLALLQYFATKRSLAYLATQGVAVNPVKPQRTTPDWAWALTLSLLSCIVALGFSPILLGNLELYFMQQYWYDSTSYSAITRDVPYMISALTGVIVFVLTILIRRDTRKKAAKLSQTTNNTEVETSVSE